MQYAKTLPVNTYDELDNSRIVLVDYLPEVGITSEQATEATTFFTNTENRINGVSTGNVFGDFMNKFKF